MSEKMLIFYAVLHLPGTKTVILQKKLCFSTSLVLDSQMKMPASLIYVRYAPAKE